MCSLLPLANTISPWLDSPLPPLSPPHSTLGATSSANQPSNDACFPTIQTTKKAIQGVGGFSVSRCHQRKGWLSRTKPSHLPPPPPCICLGAPSSCPLQGCMPSPYSTSPSTHSHQSLKIPSPPHKYLQHGSYQQLNPPPIHTINPTW